MTDIDKYALVLFKEYSLLQLKAYHADFMEKQKGKAGGATEAFEMLVINQAIAYHRTYRTAKINKEKHGLFQQ